MSSPTFFSDGSTPNRTDTEYEVLQKILGRLTDLSSGGGGGGSGTVLDVAVATANGFSGTVANATTHPSITIVAGAITPTTVNGLTITATTGTLNVAAGKTLIASNSITLSGTDSTVWTGPSTSFSVARIDAAQSFAGIQTFSDRIINTVNGASAAPAVSISGTPFTGGTAATTVPLVKIGSGTDLGYITQGALVGINAASGFAGYMLQFLTNGVSVGNVNSAGSAVFSGVSSTGNFRATTDSSLLSIGVNNDVILTRGGAAANLRLGASDAASPVAQTLSTQSVVAGNTDTGGVDFTIQGSRGTGTAKSGNLVRKTGNTSTTGSTQHTLSTREMVAAKFVDLTSATATTLFTITVGTASYTGITIDCTVFASDSTDHQVLHSVVNVAAVNKAGTITATVTQVDGAATNSAGTLTPVTYSVTDNGSGILAVKVAATSSLSETILRAKWQARINSNDVSTVVAS